MMTIFRTDFDAYYPMPDAQIRDLAERAADEEPVWAIHVNGDWYYVGDDLDTLEDYPHTDQCTACGGHAIERKDHHYVCVDFEIDGATYPGCGYEYVIELKRPALVVFP